MDGWNFTEEKKDFLNENLRARPAGQQDLQWRNSGRGNLNLLLCLIQLRKEKINGSKLVRLGTFLLLLSLLLALPFINSISWRFSLASYFEDSSTRQPEIQCQT
jgi:hypothetical protein